MRMSLMGLLLVIVMMTAVNAEVVFQDDFENYGPYVVAPTPNWTGGTSYLAYLTMETFCDSTYTHSGDMGYNAYCSNSMDKSVSGSLSTAISLRPDGAGEGTFTASAWFYISSKDSVGSAQASSKTGIFFKDINDHIGTYAVIACARYHANPTINYFNGATYITLPVSWPTDTYMNFQVTVDELHKKWGFTLTDSGGNVLASVPDIAYTILGGTFSSVSTMSIYFESANRNDGFNNYVDDVTIDFVAAPRVAAPVYSPSERYISGPTEITITTATEGANIYYTTDGTTPSAGSTPYTGPVTVDIGTTLKAVAVKDEYSNSPITSVTYKEDQFLNLQWGPIQPNGRNGSAFYMNNSIVDGCALGATNNNGPWLMNKSGAVVCSLVNANTARCAVKVGDYIYYSDSDGTGTIYRTSANTWEAPGTAVTISDGQKLISLTTDGTNIYGSTTSTVEGKNQVYKYSVDSSTGALTLLWGTSGIEATGVRGLAYDARGYVYAVSGGRNSSTSTENTAHLYAILASDGTVTDMGAITHMGEAYQVVRVDNQIWVADALSVTDGLDGQIYVYTLNGNTALASTTPTVTFNPEGIDRIFGLAVDDDFVWMATATGQVYGYTFDRVTAIPGDANGDGMVDVGDLGILAANYGGTDKTWAEGDFNGDGLVDVGDLGILAANYGTGSGASGDFSADYAKIFGTAADTDDTDDESTICSSLGFSLIAGLALMGLMIVKVEE